MKGIHAKQLPGRTQCFTACMPTGEHPQYTHEKWQLTSEFQEAVTDPFFMEIIVLFCFMLEQICIWLVQNDSIFRGDQSTLERAKCIFVKEVPRVINVAMKTYFPQINI